jgi:hypothetical protein
LQIYFSPEVFTPYFHVLNVVDQNQKAVGYLTFLFDDKKMYVYGHLQEKGVYEDYKDLIKPYIEGMAKTKKDIEVYSYISSGGEKIENNSEGETQSGDKNG